jgi:hypothetical protein
MRRLGSIRYSPPTNAVWEAQDYYIENLVEKIDLRSLFKPVCEPFRVALSNAGGWFDINGRAGMAERFAYWEARDKKCVLLYCGDLDPGGLIISDKLRKNFEDLYGATGWDPENLIIDRFGLNLDFIRRHRLSWINNLHTGSTGRTGLGLDDHRHPDHFKPYVQTYIAQYGARKVEANALVVRPEAGRNLCRQAINKYVPVDALENYEQFLRRPQAALKRAIRAELRLRLK